MMAGNRKRNPPPSWGDIMLYGSLAVGAYLGYRMLLAPQPAPVPQPDGDTGDGKRTEPLGKYKTATTYPEFKSWYTDSVATTDYTQQSRAIAVYTGFTEVMALEVLQWWKGFESVGRYPYETEWLAEIRAVGTRYRWVEE
jgi:hypothetical protein